MTAAELDRAAYCFAKMYSHEGLPRSDTHMLRNRFLGLLNEVGSRMQQQQQQLQQLQQLQGCEVGGGEQQQGGDVGSRMQQRELQREQGGEADNEMQDDEAAFEPLGGSSGGGHDEGGDAHPHPHPHRQQQQQRPCDLPTVGLVARTLLACAKMGVSPPPDFVRLVGGGGEGQPGGTELGKQ